MASRDRKYLSGRQIAHGGAHTGCGLVPESWAVANLLAFRNPTGPPKRGPSFSLPDYRTDLVRESHVRVALRRDFSVVPKRRYGLAD